MSRRNWSGPDLLGTKHIILDQYQCWRFLDGIRFYRGIFGQILSWENMFWIYKNKKNWKNTTSFFAQFHIQMKTSPDLEVHVIMNIRILIMHDNVHLVLSKCLTLSQTSIKTDHYPLVNSQIMRHMYMYIHILFICKVNYWIANSELEAAVIIDWQTLADDFLPRVFE